MNKRKPTNRKLYLLNMILFFGFAFEFYIRDDNFFGSVMIFTGLINLIAYQQAPSRIAAITILINLFNALIAFTVSYNYSEINYLILYVGWLLIGISYFIATVMQSYHLASYKKSKRKRRKNRV